VGVIDKGHYYVVFIPKKYKSIYERGVPDRIKYPQFLTVENVWPWIPKETRPERYQRIIELNAPAAIVRWYQGKKPGEPGAKGIYILHWDAKTITINKENVVSIDVY
jgi:hypothetical protein